MNVDFKYGCLVKKVVSFIDAVYFKSIVERINNLNVNFREQKELEMMWEDNEFLLPMRLKNMVEKFRPRIIIVTALPRTGIEIIERKNL